MSPDRHAVERRLQEKNGEDAKEARLLGLLGIPFALASFLALAVLVSSLLWILRLGVGCGTSIVLSAGLYLAAVVLDLWFYRSDPWRQAVAYREAAPEPSPKEAGATEEPAPKEVSDSLENLRYAAGKVAHLFLGGPRNLRKGRDLRDLIRARSEEDAVSAGTLFLQWLRQKGRTPEADLEAALSGNARLRLGYTLDTELGLLEWKTVEGRRVVDIRAIQGVT